MTPPAVSLNEALRQTPLSSYQVIDTEGEGSFDALTRLAAGVLDVPIVLVSLLGVDQQWFASQYGLDAVRAPRDVSLCTHIVAAGAPIVVQDCLNDSRFARDALTPDQPPVRFYAGVPLRGGDGLVLGTLCAIDHVPRAPSILQMQMLELLADQVVDRLEARRRRRLLAEEHAAAVDDTHRLTVLLEAMTEGVIAQDASGAIISANAAAERILGLTFDQMAGRTSFDPRWSAVHEDGTPFPGDMHPASVVLRTGEPVMNVIMGVAKLDGGLTWLSVNALPIRDERAHKPRTVIITFHDVTAIKAAQLSADRVARSEHLVTTGTLAAGIGHEINNPLTYVLSNVDYAIEELRAIAGGSPTGRLLELVNVLNEAREGAERVRKIVRGLRALARQESEPIPTLVTATIDVSIGMAAHETRHKATVVKELSETPPVLADEARLTQILVNLIVNAAQAFETGDVAKNVITIAAFPDPEGGVAITVSDNGPGITPELQRRIFDPFFTTKLVGEGTGLGLSISQSIARALGGDLVVRSSPGVGTEFRVRLPTATEPLGPPSSKRFPETGPRGRVLVVDDEPAILNTIRRSLEKAHEVTVTLDPREALLRFEQGQRFDVVFCDLMMPHLSGDALYERVKVVAPDQAERFVFITGGATEPRVQGFLSEVQNERLEKPFDVQNLRGIVRRCVRARTSIPAPAA